jgi:hypothetical protein
VTLSSHCRPQHLVAPRRYHDTSHVQSFFTSCLFSRPAAALAQRESAVRSLPSHPVSASRSAAATRLAPVIQQVDSSSWEAHCIADSALRVEDPEYSAVETGRSDPIISFSPGELSPRGYFGITFRRHRVRQENASGRPSLAILVLERSPREISLHNHRRTTQQRGDRHEMTETPLRLSAMNEE